MYYEKAQHITWGTKRRESRKVGDEERHSPLSSSSPLIITFTGYHRRLSIGKLVCLFERADRRVQIAAP